MSKPNQVSKKTQKKIAIINDLSGYGRCSLTVALPVISAMGIQACPVPTSILSNHTAYPVFFFDDYTDKMPAYISKWKELGLYFDGILTGFLGSDAQIDIVESFIHDFPQARVIIDPIMGDHGKTYSTFTPRLCDRMKQLVTHADVLTPNLTEACILTGTTYRSHFSGKELAALLEKLSGLCPGEIVISGVDAGAYLANILFDPKQEADSRITCLRKKRIAAERCGTGDIFSAIIAAGTVQGMPLQACVAKAAGFVSRCLKETAGYELSSSDGVVFEPILKYL